MKKLLLVLGLVFSLSVIQPVHAQTVEIPNFTISAECSQNISCLQQVLDIWTELVNLFTQLAQAQNQTSQNLTTVSSKVDTIIQNQGVVGSNTIGTQIIGGSSNPTPSLPACTNSGFGSISAGNCVIISPNAETGVTGGTTVTFTITAAPYTFLPLTNMPGFTLSSDNTTMTYTVDVPEFKTDGSPQNVVVSLNNGLVDPQGKPVPLSHPYYIPITQ